MAIEKAKSTTSSEFLAQFPAISNGPGEAVFNPVDGLKAIRAGKAINYSGAGSSVEFNSRGDLVNREFTQYKIVGGKNTTVGVIS
jgi:branched-chain amino acid transport system substrate-binding protein